MRTHADYEQELFEREIDYWPLQEYTRAHDKILHKCLKGHVWSAEPANILRGRGCPECTGRFTKKKTTEVHKKDLAKANPYYTLDVGQEYVNNKTPLHYTCINGHTTSLKPDHVLQGYGCKECSTRGKYSAAYFTRFPSKKSAQAFLYLVELSSTMPICLKLGITAQSKVDKRLKQVPFKCNKIIVLDMELESAYNLEQELLKEFSSFKYISDIIFDGYTELLTLDCKDRLIKRIKEVKL